MTGGKFEPKKPVELDPPKLDVKISKDDLAKAIGLEDGTCYVGIKGLVYDVTGNRAYQPGGAYHGMVPPLHFSRYLSAASHPLPQRSLLTPRQVFAGKDASRALAKSSTQAEDVSPEWKDLDEKEQGVLNDWITFFSKRYNVVGVIDGADNLAEETVPKE
ncbi:hypothetical protein RB601_009057 [Gaeumannomyces tritici]